MWKGIDIVAARGGFGNNFRVTDSFDCWLIRLDLLSWCDVIIYCFDG